MLIENTAGGDKAMARRLDAIDRLWDADRRVRAPASCSTPATRTPAGSTSPTVVDDVRAVTGRVDLVHCNNSRDAFDSGRDRHAPLAAGEIETAALVEVVRAAGAPVILETPGGPQERAAEIELLRAALG